ncbi:MAG TPA: tetratricopeptide repeat protein, partial [Jatrophihabitantaceae bacterium]
AFFAGDRDLTERLLAEGLNSSQPWVRAAVRMFRANLHENDGEVDAMAADVDLAIEEFRSLGERWGLANTLRSKAMVHSLRGELDEADAAYDEALDLMAQIKSREDEAYLLVRLGEVAVRRGDTAKARRLMQRAWESAEQSGSPLESVFTLAMLAEIERHGGDIERSRALQREAMRRVATLPPSHPAQSHGHTIVLIMGARLSFDEGDLPEAVRLGKESYTSAIATKDLPILASVGVVLADIAAQCGRAETAAEMLGAAARLRGADDSTGPDIARLTTQLRDELGGATFDERYAYAKSLDREAATLRLDPAEALSGLA